MRAAWLPSVPSGLASIRGHGPGSTPHPNTDHLVERGRALHGERGIVAVLSCDLCGVLRRPCWRLRLSKVTGVLLQLQIHKAARQGSWSCSGVSRPSITTANQTRRDGRMAAGAGNANNDFFLCGNGVSMD